MCVLNGRLNNDSVNFTCISSKGKSVVDYINTPHDCFNSCDDFKVETVIDLLEQYNIFGMIGDRCKPPDHSLLSVNFASSYNISNKNVNDEGDIEGRNMLSEERQGHYSFENIYQKNSRTMICGNMQLMS